MEEVLQSLENVAVEEPKSNSVSNYEDMYKNKGKFGNQEERRKEILNIQKRNRNDKVDKFRGILDLIHAIDEEEASIFKTKHCYKPSVFVAGFMKARYNNVLMLSEWLIEKPEDFHENWYVVPCPKGTRMLVVASQGKTKCFLKYGQFRFMEFTALPGGSPYECYRKNRCCVLDCFYDEKTNTMFVLDLLAWNNVPMTDGEMEFRNYWLQAHMTQISELTTISKKNNIKFSLLPKIDCTPDALNEFMMKFPQFENQWPTLEGLLFFHKRATYTAGETPLVGWLYPFMVQEILGMEITVNDAYTASKPDDYVDQAKYIEDFEAKKAEKEMKRRAKMKRPIQTRMDTAGVANPTGVIQNPSSEAVQNITEQQQTVDQTTQQMETEAAVASN